MMRSRKIAAALVLSICCLGLAPKAVAAPAVSALGSINQPTAALEMVAYEIDAPQAEIVPVDAPAEVELRSLPTVNLTSFASKPSLTAAQRAKFITPTPSEAWKAKYGQHVIEAARLNNVPPALVMAVIAVESGFNAAARSRDGATGLMQIKYPTARAFGLAAGGPQALFNPVTNIRVATNYLGAAYKMTGGNICAAVSRYNRGLGSNKISAEYCAKVSTIMKYADFHLE